MTDLNHRVAKSQAAFAAGRTRNIATRMDLLTRLQNAIIEYETAICDALKADLNKSVHEAYMTEIGLVLEEIRHVRKHLKTWAKPRKVKTPLLHIPSRSVIYSQPYGVVLVIAPWNYPFQLAMSPVVGAVAAGNCCVVKPSEYAPHTAAVIDDMVATYFTDGCLSVVQGDAAVSQALLKEPFDYIFFTGGTTVGKKVMAAAAQHLTPVTLELGGKSPCIVDRDVRIDLAAKRIVSGKFLNAGQTCIAPDYLLVHRSVETALIERLKHTIDRFYGQRPIESDDYPRIVNRRHFNRLNALISGNHVIYGGQTDIAQRYIAPTLVYPVTWSDSVMQEEIFGPILPIMPFGHLDEVIAMITAKPKPLALYFFSTNTHRQRRIIEEVSFGGGCINDTVLHVANPHLPFGGIGDSGMGHYHGKAGFETFSHQKSILKKPFWPDPPLRYPPYRHLNWLKKLMK